MKPMRLVLAATLALLLAACGGSSYEAPPPPPTVMETPQQREDRAASASIDGLIAFMMGLVGSASADAEPRPIDGITPPASDTAEPQTL